MVKYDTSVQNVHDTVVSTSDNGMSKGAIVGLIVGFSIFIIMLAIIIPILVHCCASKNKK
jgi:hypothetical protein